MVISYPARIPERSSFWCTVAATVPRIGVGQEPISILQQDLFGQSGAYLIGRFSDRGRDVCARYYKSRGKRPPYLALKECGDDLESIVKFTEEWGPLGKSPGRPAWIYASVSRRRQGLLPGRKRVDTPQAAL